MRAKRLGGSPAPSVNTLRRWRSLTAGWRASSETRAGATGTIGRELTRLLAAKGEQVRAMTRDLARGRTLPAGVQVVPGDFSDHESLAGAVAGAKALFLLSAPGPSMVQHDRAM